MLLELACLAYYAFRLVHNYSFSSKSIWLSDAKHLVIIGIIWVSYGYFFCKVIIWVRSSKWYHNVTLTEGFLHFSILYVFCIYILKQKLIVKKDKKNLCSYLPADYCGHDHIHLRCWVRRSRCCCQGIKSSQTSSSYQFSRNEISKWY